MQHAQNHILLVRQHARRSCTGHAGACFTRAGPAWIMRIQTAHWWMSKVTFCSCAAPYEHQALNTGLQEVPCTLQVAAAPLLSA